MTIEDSDNSFKQEPNRQTQQVIRWRCPNCGQMLFTAPDFEPPDICAYCRDMTTWEKVAIEPPN